MERRVKQKKKLSRFFHFNYLESWAQTYLISLEQSSIQSLHYGCVCVCAHCLVRIRYNVTLHRRYTGRIRLYKIRIHFYWCLNKIVLTMPGHTMHHIHVVKLVNLNGFGYIISFCRTLRHNFSVNIANINRPTVCLTHEPCVRTKKEM